MPVLPYAQVVDEDRVRFSGFERDMLVTDR